LNDYPSPASGCLLTDYGYSQRLRDLMTYSERLNFQDLNLLRVGRQFRISPESKLILGRNETENNHLQQYANQEVYTLEARQTGSPLGLVYGSPTEEDLQLSASVLARYSGAKNSSEVTITLMRNKIERDIIVSPGVEAVIGKLRIQ